MSRLIDCLGTTEALAEVFSDRSVLQAMLDYEAALARAAARAGAIPESAARSISTAARAEHFDVEAIARDARASATPTIPLVEALTRRVRAADPASAEFVHWGATSQDVTDGAMVLLLRRGKTILDADQARLQRALRSVSEEHAGTIMLGRTLLQPATPITFGLKAALWYAAVVRAWRRLSSAWLGALVLQWGGAAGTRAAAGEHSPSVAAGLAAELDLAAVPPWHADRDRLGALVSAAALYTVSLGKVARDVALLMQAEVGEVAEPGGGSSTMPQKRNPSGCALAIASALRMPALAAAFLGGMLHEHERSVGGGQAEWPTIASAVQATGSALAAMVGVVEGLTVDVHRMRANVEATGGVIFAERAVTLLGRQLGRSTARALVTDAVRRSRETGRTFGEVLRENAEISRVVDGDTLSHIDRPEEYLGEAESLRRQLLDESPTTRTEQT